MNQSHVWVVCLASSDPLHVCGLLCLNSSVLQVHVMPSNQVAIEVLIFSGGMSCIPVVKDSPSPPPPPPRWCKDIVKILILLHIFKSSYYFEEN